MHATLHLDQFFTAELRERGNGLVAWLGVTTIDDESLVIFSSREGFAKIADVLNDYLRPKGREGGKGNDAMPKGQRPNYVIAVVEERDGQADRWTDVGVCFVNESSNTLKIKLSAVPLSGELVGYRPKRWDDAEPPVLEEK
jgi:hypothetical protein